MYFKKLVLFFLVLLLGFSTLLLKPDQLSSVSSNNINIQVKFDGWFE